VILAAALLEILSVLPGKESIRTDETFRFTVRVRNAGDAAAENVRLRAGGNADTLFRSIEGPPEWTCDAAGPRFALAGTCTTESMPAGAEAAFTVTLAAPQPTAVTYRIGATIAAAGIKTTKLERGLDVDPSEVQAELSMTARRIDGERAAFDVRNDGPGDAANLLVLVSNAALASGDGWTCAPTAAGMVCTRLALAPKTTSTLEARGADSAKLEARVRAEQILEERPYDNSARP
jgi:Domain of unknown function DUF11